MAVVRLGMLPRASPCDGGYGHGGYTYRRLGVTSGEPAWMAVAKKRGMRKAPKEAMAEDQPSTGGASDLSKMIAI